MNGPAFVHAERRDNIHIVICCVWMRACIMHSRSTLAGAYWLKVFMLAAHNARSLRRRPICLPIAFNIKLFAACSTPRAHTASLLLCIYTQCSLPNLYNMDVWVHTPGPALHAPAARTIGSQTKALKFSSAPSRSPLANTPKSQIAFRVMHLV